MSASSHSNLAKTEVNCPLCNLVSHPSTQTCQRCKFPICGTEEEQRTFIGYWTNIKKSYFELESRLLAGRKAIRVMAVLSIVGLLLILTLAGINGMQFANSVFTLVFVLQILISMGFVFGALVLLKRAPRPTFAIATLVLALMSIVNVYLLFVNVNYFQILIRFFIVLSSSYFCFRAYLATGKYDRLKAQYQELLRLRTGQDPEEL